jgi:hypothetical protein
MDCDQNPIHMMNEKNDQPDFGAKVGEEPSGGHSSSSIDMKICNFALRNRRSAASSIGFKIRSVRISAEVSEEIGHAIISVFRSAGLRNLCMKNDKMIYF